MKKKRLAFILLGTFFLGGSVFAQNQKKDKVATDSLASTGSNQAQSMLLNASSDNGPREINIGLPSDIAGTVILENGMPVTYDSQSQSPNRVWRADGSFQRVRALNLYKTAIYNGSIGVSMSSESGRGTDGTKGAVGLTTNSFGLIRANAKVSGSGKNGFQYQVSTFVNMDPSTMRNDFSRFMDKTIAIRAFLNKKYKGGQIGIQYKFMDSEGSNSLNQNPYIYHADGTVSSYKGLSIGKTAYAEKSGKAYPRDVFTGEQLTWDLMKETGSTSHVIDILGDHKFNNGLKFNYTGRLHFAESGFWNPNLGTIFTASSIPATERYVYRDNPNMVYEGDVQRGQMAVANKWGKLGFAGRFELGKKSAAHDWIVGLSEQGLDARDAFRAVYGTFMTLENNPSALVYQKNQGGNWVNVTDENGSLNSNGALQYYDGLDNKLAVYIMDKWNIGKRFTVDLGARFEWQSLDGYWAPKGSRAKTSDGKSTVIIGKESLSKNWYNKSGSLNFLYKAFDRAGFTADALYAEVGGNLSSYAQAVDPELKQSKTKAFSVGAYFNHPIVSITSKLNYINRSNYSFAGNFENPANPSEVQRAVINYDVQTLGWTTDAEIKPFKGMNLHMLMTIQSPKYNNFNFTMFGQEFNFTDMTARGVSKVLLEIEPSYSWKNFKVWGTARFFSKQYACFSNALYFASRWETFAGFDYKLNKNVNFGVNIVNLLNEAGAQGNIAGANTITKADAVKYYDQPLAGTYIRPFTIEFKTNIKF